MTNDNKNGPSGQPSQHAHPQPNDTSDRSFDETVAAFQAARAEFDHFDQEVFAPAYYAWEEACAAIPNASTSSSFENSLGQRINLSTENSLTVATAREHLERPLRRSRDPEFDRACRELVEADNARRAKCDRLAEQYRLAELQSEYHRRFGEAHEAINAVIAYPICTKAKLIAKLELLNELGFELPVDVVIADVRRIAAAGG